MRGARRHSLAMLKYQEIEERHWSNWSMGFAAPNADKRALFLKYSSQSIFNPYVMKADAAEKMLMDLSDTAISMTPPAEQPAPAAAAQDGGIFARFLKKRCALAAIAPNTAGSLDHGSVGADRFRANTARPDGDQGA